MPILSVSFGCIYAGSEIKMKRLLLIVVILFCFGFGFGRNNEVHTKQASVNDVLDVELTVYNRGEGHLHISDIYTNNKNISMFCDTAYMVPGGDSTYKTLKFLFNRSGRQKTKVTVVSDDPENPEYNIHFIFQVRKGKTASNMTHTGGTDSDTSRVFHVRNGGNTIPFGYSSLSNSTGTILSFVLEGSYNKMDWISVSEITAETTVAAETSRINNVFDIGTNYFPFYRVITKGLQGNGTDTICKLWLYNEFKSKK